MFGEEPISLPYGFWTDKTILNELNILYAELGHFPTQRELIAKGRHDIINAIKRHGGSNRFRKLMGVELIQVPNGYWTEDTILEDLKKLTAGSGKFPTDKGMKLTGHGDLAYAISTHGGINHFRKLLGYEVEIKSRGYWTKEKTIEELKKLNTELGHFPTMRELGVLRQSSLGVAISKYGGIRFFKEMFGEEPLHLPNGYWTEEKTFEELKKLITETGHFPKQIELIIKGRHDLLIAISKHGGINYFREQLGEEPLYAPDGYWNEDTILDELKKVTAKTIHFPTHTELKRMKRTDLSTAISKNGGAEKYRKLLGYPPSLEEFMGQLAYNSRKGYKSEKEVKKILLKYCKQNSRPEPTYCRKLAIGNVIEFVCGGKIGIDVTNTKDPSEWIIKRKYLEKDYHKYLDKLWIVVLSDIYTNEDYIRLNEEAPDNVEIMSVWDLIETLQVDIDEHSRRKLEALETCTLRTKNDLINQLKNRSLSEFA